MKQYWYFILIIASISCSDNPNNQSRAASIIEIADAYYGRFLETFPEMSYYFDLSLERHDEIQSNKLSDITKWESFEDSLYNEFSRLDVNQILQKKDKITYWLLKEELESNIGMRICKRNLWDIDHMGGWHTRWIDLAEFQPVGSEEFRIQAIDRWKKLPSFVDTEIKNLKNGLSTGYSMPKVIVEIVIDQLQVLQDYKIEESPLMSPANRDDNQAFQKEWSELVEDKILPAIKKYQNFLKDEYLDQTREEVSILAIPNGSDCYQAYIRKYTTTNQSGERIFESGQKVVAASKAKISELGLELYQKNDFTEIIKLFNSDTSNYFKSAEEVLEVNNQLLTTAKKESEKWFDVLPSTEVTIKPYEPHESGIGSYELAKGDKPAYFRINLNNPEQQKRGENEKLNFHEAYPGHHLQIGIQKDIENLHPISNLIWFGSYGEGWARYSEQLAEEMGLYETKTGLISRRAFLGRGMVIDPGLHLKNWTKEEVMSFVTESGYNEDIALSLYHRIIIWPTQLTSYDVGGEEIKALRRLAEQKLGDDFDVKEFHTKILEYGPVPLSVLRSSIDEWIDSKLE